MDENEIRQQQIGFMNAVGLLLQNSDPAVRDNIIATLTNFGGQLFNEAINASNGAVAADAGVHPCQPPLVWNPETMRCE